MHPRRIAGLFSPAWLIALLAFLVLQRLALVERMIGSYLGCPRCFDTRVLAADAPLLAAVAGLLLAAGLVRRRPLGRALQVVAGLVVLVYLADLIVFRLFNSRLFLADVQLFIAEPAAIWNQFAGGFGGPLVAGSVLAGVLALPVWLALSPPVRGRAARLLLTAVLAVALLSAALTRTGVYVNDWAVENVFAANLATGEHTPYSAAAARAARAALRPARQVTGPAPGAGRDVILVLLESWSPWHSGAWGGYESWTPHLDAAARRGTAFTNFHAIGFSTDKGLVGILAGQQLWSPFLHPFELSPFHSMWGVERTLPRPFAAHGYHTAFLTSGPLSLYRKGEWLRQLGFDEVEGNENAFYAAEPRFAFDAASDRALYARAAAWQRQARRPWLLVLETVTTHQPYTDPDTGTRSLERAMRFADRAFAGFLDELDRSGFFDHGILVVASDHRSMTPVPAHELDTWGSAALSRVPAFVIGRGFEPGTRDARVYSQSDLVPSFELWLGGQTRLEPHQGVMFGLSQRPDAQPAAAIPRCAFHARFDLRGRIDVHCDQGSGQVRLDGDDTAFVSATGLDPATRADVLATLTVLRIEGLERHRRRMADSGDGTH